MDHSLPTSVIIAAAVFAVLALWLIVSVACVSSRRSAFWVTSTTVSGILFLMFLAGVGIYGVGSRIRAAGAPAVVGPQVGADGVLHAKNATVTMQVPPSWTYMPEMDPEAIISVGSWTEEQYLVVRALPKTEYPGSLNDLHYWYSKYLQDGLEGASASEPSYEPVHNHWTIRQRVAGKLRDRNLVYHTALVETTDVYYWILAFTTPQRESLAAPQLRAIIDSFEEISPSTSPSTTPPPEPEPSGDATLPEKPAAEAGQ